MKPREDRKISEDKSITDDLLKPSLVEEVKM